MIISWLIDDGIKLWLIDWLINPLNKWTNDWANGWANDRTNDWSNDGFDWWIEQEFPHNVEFISGNYVPQSDQLFGKHSGRGGGANFLNNISHRNL